MHKHTYGTIKSFKALLTNGDQLQIPLHKVGKGVGFRIKKLQVMPHDIDGSSSHECSVQIWKQKQSSLSVDLDFSNSELVGAAYYVRANNPVSPYVALISEQTVIFDNEVFNQDIFIVYKSGITAQKINYYMELEEVKMSGPHEAVVNFDAIISRT